MCIVFRETEYHNGLIVVMPAEFKSKKFHILMTKYLKNHPYKYSGICLDNGLQVTTDKHEKYVALCDIIEKIVDSTIITEREYITKYPSRTFKPFENIFEEDHALRKIFLKKMKNSYSLREYNSIQKRLNAILEKPRDVPEKNIKRMKKFASIMKTRLLVAGTVLSILPNLLPVIYDCKDIALASNKVREDDLLKDTIINYGRT